MLQQLPQSVTPGHDGILVCLFTRNRSTSKTIIPPDAILNRVGRSQLSQFIHDEFRHRCNYTRIHGELRHNYKLCDHADRGSLLPCDHLVVTCPVSLSGHGEVWLRGSRGGLEVDWESKRTTAQLSGCGHRQKWPRRGRTAQRWHGSVWVSQGSVCGRLSSVDAMLPPYPRPSPPPPPPPLPFLDWRCSALV